MRKLIVGTVVVSLSVLLLISPLAAASRKPTARERTLILEAATRHSATCFFAPEGSCRSFIRVSTKGPWAALHLNPTPGHENVVQPGIASFRRIGSEAWQFHSVVPGWEGCGVPRVPRRDLGLDCLYG